MAVIGVPMTAAVTVRITAVTMIVVAAVSVWVRHFDNTPLLATAGKLHAAAEKHHDEQRCDINQLAHEIADRQSQDVMAAIRRRGDQSPNQNPNRTNQQQAE